MQSVAISGCKSRGEGQQLQTLQKDQFMKTSRRVKNTMNIERPNEQPYQLVLRPQVQGNDTIGNQVNRMLGMALLDCDKGSDGYKVCATDNKDLWDQNVDIWTRDMRKTGVAVITLLENERGQLGAMTVGGLMGRTYLIVIEYHAWWKTLAGRPGAWTAAHMPELHRTLRDSGVTKVIAGAYLAHQLLVSGETEEVLYPVLDLSLIHI